MAPSCLAFSGKQSGSWGDVTVEWCGPAVYPYRPSREVLPPPRSELRTKTSFIPAAQLPERVSTGLRRRLNVWNRDWVVIPPDSRLALSALVLWEKTVPGGC